MSALLEVKDLRVLYRRIEGLRRASLRIAPGAIVTVIGPNGAGKSTLLGAVMGLLASSGEARFEGRDLAGVAVEERVRRGLSLVPERRELFGELSVEDNLLLGAFQRERRRSALALDLDAVCRRFPRLAERRAQLAGTLSGGQQQMLAIGIALMHAPRLILLDEPSIGLAPNLVEKVMQAVVEINRAYGATILMIEQNVKASLPIAHRVAVLKTGRKIYDGAPEPLSDPVRLMELF